MRLTSPDWWNPTKVIIALFVGAVILDSISAVWGERRPVGGFFEEFIARVGSWALIFGSFGGGIYLGLQAFEKSKNKLIAWVAGIIACLGISLAGGFILSSIPGVDWRFDRVMNSDGGDY